MVCSVWTRSALEVLRLGVLGGRRSVSSAGAVKIAAYNLVAGLFCLCVYREFYRYFALEESRHSQSKSILSRNKREIREWQRHFLLVLLLFA